MHLALAWGCRRVTGMMERGAVVSESTAYFDVDGTLVGTNLIHPTVMYFANQASPRQTLARMGRA